MGREGEMGRLGNRAKGRRSDGATGRRGRWSEVIPPLKGAVGCFEETDNQLLKFKTIHDEANTNYCFTVIHYIL